MKKALNITKMLSKCTKLDELLDESPKQVNLNWKSRLRRKFKKQGIIEALEDYNLKTDKSLLNKIGKCKRLIFSLLLQKLQQPGPLKEIHGLWKHSS